AREVAKRLAVPIEFVPFDAAGKVVDALANGAWDIAFLAIDPVRGAGIDFTAPYVLIEGAYVVPADSGLKTVEDVDRDGVRVAVAPASAYDLYLTRALKHAKLVPPSHGPPRPGDCTKHQTQKVRVIRVGWATAASSLPTRRSATRAERSRHEQKRWARFALPTPAASTPKPALIAGQISIIL